jgi:hypothetical protein
MSNEVTKEIRSKRLHAEEVKIEKQIKIAKSHGLTDNNKAIKEPHRLAKHHAMDCGRPGCSMCGNPRKTLKELTIQEKSFNQTKTWIDTEEND